MRQAPDSSLRDSAIAYAQAGHPVFPLAPHDKVPLIPKAQGGRGVHDATTELARIEEWWDGEPNANIGLAAGHKAWILDADYKGWLTTEPDGADTIAAMQQRFGPLPMTPAQLTGGGGWQYFFAPDERVRNGVRRLPGLDTRAAGGYVVAPPSIHPNGSRYRWLRGRALGEVEIAPAPEWLIALLFAERPAQQQSKPIGPVLDAPTWGPYENYAKAALQRACERVALAAPGTQETTLNTEAYSIGRLVGGGVIGRSLARAALIAAGRKMPSQARRRPWTATEIERRVDRAIAAGERQPRAPEARR